MSASAIDLVEAVIGADGALISADAPLLALQRDAGGSENGPLVVPQLASLARLARRLNILVSRPIIAASSRSDISMWVRARPEGDHVRLSIVDWVERSANPPLAAAGAAQGPWRWRIDLSLHIQTVDLPRPDQAYAPPVGHPFTGWMRLGETDNGETPLLVALAGHLPFEDQPAELRADPDRRFTLSGQPLFGLDGRLSGYQGVAVPDGQPASLPSADENSINIAPLGDLASSALFGQRLDGALRAPLGRIIANADSIKGQLLGPVRDDYASYASDIADAGRHLLALVDDLADLRAIERPNFTVARELVDIADCARRAAGLLAVKASGKAIRIDTPKADERLPAAGEFRRILQILVNLIGNAVRYSPEGSSIWVRVEDEGEVARLVVADQGQGIPADAHQRIFEKFERLGRGDTGGSGLGLYISRRLARAMDGDIEIESAPGQGARFILTLPIWTD